MLDFEEKLSVLNKKELDEVDQAFSLSALKVLASRYLLKDERGIIVESPKQMFERIAILIAVSDILHDERVFDINGAQTTHTGSIFLTSHRIGQYDLNEYHLAALERLYRELDNGHMKVSLSSIFAMMSRGEFESYETRIKEYYDLMVSKDFLPNTPTLMNAGAPLGQLSACFVLEVKDNMAAIMDTAKDVAMIFKSGGGVGINYSSLRPEGDIVSTTSGVASGPISFMNVIDAVTGVVKQGGKRRGANMGIMDCTHPDVEKFIKAKSTPGVLENFNVSVGINDTFWKSVLDGGVYMLINPRTRGVVGARYGRNIMDLIAECAWKSAEPGLIFFDNINRHNPMLEAYGPITATNPCFHPDTIIETVEGRKQIKDITNPIRVYTHDNDGKLTTRMASRSWITKNDARTLKITLSNGKQIIVTPDHKLLTNKYGWVEAVNLKPKTRLVELCRHRRGARYSGIKLSTEDPRAYRMEHRFVYEQTTGATIPSNMDIHHIDGNTFNNHVLNLDIIPHNQHARLTAYTQPNNHQVKGELGRFIESGRHGQKIIINLPQELVSKRCSAPTVAKIEEGPITDVYDIAVEDTHNVIANGIVAHNCGEQSLYPYESCNLGSINLSNFVLDGKFDWIRFEKVVRLCTHFLDNVIDVNKYPLARIDEETKKTRRIGLGVMGLADLLFKLDIAYNSARGYELMGRIAEDLSWHSMNESTMIALKRGSFPMFDKSGYAKGALPFAVESPSPWDLIKIDLKYRGLRNAWTTTIAPTGTLSMLADCSSGIEPVFGLSFEKHVTVGKFNYTNQQFLDAYSEASPERIRDVVEAVVQNHGSARGLKCVTPEKQKVFVTAMDIHWADHVYAEAVWQKWISNAIAKTINMPHNSTKNDVRLAYMLAHELGLKGITVYRDGSRASQVLHVNHEGKTIDRLIPSKTLKEVIDGMRLDQYIWSNLVQIFNYHDTTGIAVPLVAGNIAGAIEFTQGGGFPCTIAGNKIGVLEPDKCPQCLWGSVLRTEGCQKCISCGWSACSSG